MKARLLYARLDSLQEDYAGNDPDVIALRYAADYDAETTRADRAEAGCAALVDFIKREYPHPPYAINDQYDEQASYDEAQSLIKQPHPGSRFLELAQIVEKLQENHTLTLAHARLVANCDGDAADALARLLAWRREQRKGEQGKEQG